MDGNRSNECRNPEDQGNVANVKAIGVPQCQPRVTLGGREGGYHHLGGRGDKPDHYHADQQWRHTKMPRNCSRAVDKTIGAPDQQHKACKHRKRGCYHAISSFCTAQAPGSARWKLARARAAVTNRLPKTRFICRWRRGVVIKRNSWLASRA